MCTVLPLDIDNVLAPDWLKNIILEEATRIAYRNEIVRLFTMRDMKEKGESYCDTFSTTEEVQAGYMYLSALHIKTFGEILERACNDMKIAVPIMQQYLNVQPIAA